MAFREVNKEKMEESDFRSYSSKLSDPRWLEKSNRILLRDHSQCVYCKSSKDQFNVHHKKYTGDPWEAQDEDLITVCVFCHLVIEDFKKRFFKEKSVLMDIQRQDCILDALGLTYRVVLTEAHGGDKLVIIYEFKDRDFKIVYWGSLFELAGILNKFKTMKFN